MSPIPPNVPPLSLVWGDHAAGRAIRAVLLPAEWAYRGAIAARNELFDRGVLSVLRPALPAIAIGNLTVGGTGKTPLASYVAGRLRAAGARPAILLRGYGEDETAVHRLLQPGVEVVASADRVAGAARARQAGCDVAVLDDAFQHRRIERVVDVVLVSADAPWATHCLPAGPLREPWPAIARADLVVITRKAAAADAVQGVRARLTRLRVCNVAYAQLTLDRLRDARELAPDAAVADLAGRRVLAIAGIGDPGAFFAQLRDAGATVESAAFTDHRAYADTDVKQLLRRAESAEFVVCTLKDAVKLQRLWPRSGPTLWYVSQRVVLGEGHELVEQAVHRVLAARSTADL